MKALVKRFKIVTILLLGGLLSLINIKPKQMVKEYVINENIRLYTITSPLSNYIDVVISRERKSKQYFKNNEYKSSYIRFPQYCDDNNEIILPVDFPDSVILHSRFFEVKEHIHNEFKLGYALVDIFHNTYRDLYSNTRYNSGYIYITPYKIGCGYGELAIDGDYKRESLIVNIL